MREALFSPIFWGEALYAPPFRRRFFINSAPAIERVGAAIGLPFAGVQIVEATKQVYRPVGVRRLARREVDGAAASPRARARQPRHRERRCGAVFEIVAGGGSCF